MILEEIYEVLGKVHAREGSSELYEIYQKIGKVINFKVYRLHGNAVVRCQEIPDEKIRHALIEVGIYVLPSQTYYKEK